MNMTLDKFGVHSNKKRKYVESNEINYGFHNLHNLFEKQFAEHIKKVETRLEQKINQGLKKSDVQSLLNAQKNELLGKINGKKTKLEEKVDGLVARVNNLNSSKQLDEKIGKINKKLAEFDAVSGKLETSKIDGYNEEFKKLNSKVKEIEEIGKNNAIAIENNFKIMNIKFNSSDESTGNALRDLTIDVRKLEGKIDPVAEKLNKFEETTSYQRQKIEGVGEDFKKLSSKVEKLEKDLDNETVLARNNKVILNAKLEASDSATVNSLQDLTINLKKLEQKIDAEKIVEKLKVLDDWVKKKNVSSDELEKVKVDLTYAINQANIAKARITANDENLDKYLTGIVIAFKKLGVDVKWD